MNGDPKAQSSAGKQKHTAPQQGSGASFSVFSPVEGRVHVNSPTTHYREYTHRHHDGLDLNVSSGTRVNAVANGVVVFMGQMDGYQNIMIVEHKLNDGTVLQSWYAHLSKFGDKLKVGSEVKGGSEIAKSGSDHLHVEVRIGSVARMLGVDGTHFTQTKNSYLSDKIDVFANEKVGNSLDKRGGSGVASNNIRSYVSGVFNYFGIGTESSATQSFLDNLNSPVDSEEEDVSEQERRKHNKMTDRSDREAVALNNDNNKYKSNRFSSTSKRPRDLNSTESGEDGELKAKQSSKRV